MHGYSRACTCMHMHVGLISSYTCDCTRMHASIVLLYIYIILCMYAISQVMLECFTGLCAYSEGRDHGNNLVCLHHRIT